MVLTDFSIKEASVEVSSVSTAAARMGRLAWLVERRRREVGVRRVEEEVDLRPEKEGRESVERARRWCSDD